MDHVDLITYVSQFVQDLPKTRCFCQLRTFGWEFSYFWYRFRHFSTCEKGFKIDPIPVGPQARTGRGGLCPHANPPDGVFS